MNLLTNFYNLISTLYKYFLDKYTYKNMILYIVKSSPCVHELVYEHIILFELSLFNNRA